MDKTTIRIIAKLVLFTALAVLAVYKLSLSEEPEESFWYEILKTTVAAVFPETKVWTLT